MKKINILTRFQRAITDFSFANHFLKESSGKAIRFMLMGYLLFLVAIVISAMIFIRPEMVNISNEMENVITDLPEFTIEQGEFILDGDQTYFEYGDDNLMIFIDLDEKNGDAFYSKWRNYYLVRRNMIMANGAEMFNFSTLTNVVTKDSMLGFSNIVLILFYVTLGVFSVLGVIGVFIISALVWALVVIINGVMSKNISTGECYKIAIYSMVVPGIVLTLDWVFTIGIPYFSLIYLAIAAGYAVMFIKGYDEEDDNFDEIYE